MPSTKGAQYHDKSQRQRRDMTPILGTLITIEVFMFRVIIETRSVDTKVNIKICVLRFKVYLGNLQPSDFKG